ncbi:hypothetical protein TruAng_008634 [Truncatella angustata]|nr:hypothetical protein TruAng_008634 [Truncatella angustata]
MSSLGDKIKSVLGGGHSTDAEKDVEHRTPGAYPEESDVHGGVDQPRVGTKPIPSSGERDLGGTLQDPGLITGPSEHNTESSTNNKLHKKDDPRGNASYPAHDTSSSGLGHSHNEPSSGLKQVEHSSTNPYSSTHPSSHHDNTLPLRDLGGDRSGQRTQGLTGSSTGTTGTSSGLTGAHTGTTGSSGLTGTGNTQSGSHSGTGAGPAAGARVATAGALAGHGGDHNKVGNGGVKSEITSEEPYWGDLPQGAGVYNGVTGHGSGENTSGQHRAVPRTGDASEASRIGKSGESRAPQSIGVHNAFAGYGSNRDDHTNIGSGNQREFPLNSGSVHGGATGTAVSSGTIGQREGDIGPHNGVANAIDPRVDSDHDGSRSTGGTSGISGTGLTSGTSGRRDGDNSHRDRHLGEAGALGAGAAAYGAHEHHEQSIGADYDAQRAVPHGASTTHQPKSGLDSTSNQPHNTSTGGGLLHRHKDQTKPATQAQTPSRHHEHSGVLGLLHRNKEPKDVDEQVHDKSNFTTHHGETPISTLTGAPGATQTASHTTSSGLGKESGSGYDATRSGPDDSHTGRNLAGLGAAAGAGYGASQLGHHHNEPQASGHYGSTTSSGQTPVSQHSAVPGSHATTVAGQPHPLSGDSSTHTSRDIAGASAAAGAGYGASQLGNHHNEPSVGQHGSSLPQGGQAGTSHGLAGTTSHASEAASTYSQESAYSQDHPSHTGRNLAGAGAIAAGAGYGVSRLAQHHNEPSIGQRDSSLQGNSGQREGGTGLHNSRAANALDPRVDSDRDGSRTAGNTTSTSGSGLGTYNKLSDGTASGVAVPTSGQTTSAYNNQAGTTSNSTGNPAGDSYNHLSSGTPSGVQLDKQPHSARAAIQSPTSDTSEIQSSHHGSGTAAGLGAGVAGLHSGKYAHDATSSPKRDNYGRDANTAGAPLATDRSGTQQVTGLREAGTSAGLGSGAAATLGSKFGPGYNVTHKCTKCGEDNDISAYFKDLKQ